ncbi:indole-3-glycerol phosphate synthase TrpC [bacterium]|nr:indole-3-glycerol phosphate synthase TrpC [bacterium]
MILERILTSKKDLLGRVSGNAARYHQRIAPCHEKRDFHTALTAKGISIIAEIKQSSPSAGTIRTSFNPGVLAGQYTAGGAAAISVLTEERFFHGSPRHLIQARNHSPLPVLRKDFIIDESQIYEAAQIGADAILLIAAILGEAKLKRFMRFGRRCGLDCLVEVHREEEIDAAINAGASIIGINNRNLDSLAVSLETSFRLIGLLPDDIVTVSESGIKTRGQILMLQEAGFDAVLIGETLMRHPDPGRKLRELLGAPA